MKLNNVTIGADPELFIINEKTKRVVSSVGRIPGEKGNPYVADDMPAGFGLETDNILAEFNIPPVATGEAFVNNIEYMKQYIDKYVKNIDSNLGILCAASKMVDAGQLNSEQAQLFGCDPDFNAYTEEQNVKPEGNKTRLRSAGFHIHIGYNNPNIDTSVALIKYLDMYLGVPSVIKDRDKRRRSLYGKAGCFLLPGLQRRQGPAGEKAIVACARGSRLANPENVVQAINNSDLELARKIVEAYDIM